MVIGFGYYKSLTMIRNITFFLFFTLFLLRSGNAQIREVKSRASSYKSSSSASSSNSYSSSNDDSGDSFFIFDILFNMFTPMVRGIGEAQRRQLTFANDDPWRIGGELKLIGGINFFNPDFFNSQMIRGNYGLFSTQIRRFSLSDVSGSFNTIDWQVIQLNLVNTERVRWILGVGFSHEVEIDQEHFEWSAELHVAINEKFVPKITYRRSGDGYPRKEFAAKLEYRPFRNKKAEFAFDVGYLHQNVYDIPFKFTSIGISFYLK